MTELQAAIKGLHEDEQDRFRLAAFPVWMTNGKKGVRFNAFLAKIGLGYKTKGGAKKSKSLPGNIYERAADIKSRDPKREATNGTV